ncbi:MAG: hypothetical protein CFH10_01198 [Alphaproteobacteria bacterium MarineAlpha4_Bin2]|nr:MAG: hypothetical protein CFH10_01198 [Alphaproteobacteria bacterium MarineAlpha4_Bin2]
MKRSLVVSINYAVSMLKVVWYREWGADAANAIGKMIGQSKSMGAGSVMSIAEKYVHPPAVYL